MILFPFLFIDGRSARIPDKIRPMPDIGDEVYFQIQFLIVSIYICFGAQSIEHANVLSEKINFSAPGGRKVAIFGMEDLDPLYFDVSNFSAPPDPPYMSKNDKMCYF